MSSKRHFYLIDDDPDIISLAKHFLESDGHRVSSSTDPEQALEEIQMLRPDCVITELIMPDMDGVEICRHLRALPALDTTKLVILSAKSYEFDRQRAMDNGADGFIRKPIQRINFLNDLCRIMANSIELRFWGVRGTLPVPGPQSVRYGGNTSCVSLHFPRDDWFVFDAGTGIRELGRHLMARSERVRSRIFISHPHWDHINALPFFLPLFVPGNEIEIFGGRHDDRGMRELVRDQMSAPYFPITTKELGAHIEYVDLREQKLAFGDIQVASMRLNHPGNCLGYRVDYNGKRICYITDHELFRPDLDQYSDHYVRKMVSFIKGADELIMDSTYADDEYDKHIGWGHSCVGQVAETAHLAEVKRLHLFHHDLHQTDDDIDAKLESATRQLQSLGSNTQVAAPAEGDVIMV